MDTEQTKVTVIDDRSRQEEAEALCRWAAARARRYRGSTAGGYDGA